MTYRSRHQGYKATPERASKTDYAGPKERRYRVDTLRNLERRGKIDGETFTAAMKWLKIYIYAKDGYADFLRNSLPRGAIKGDAITFGLSRGKAWEIIHAIQRNIGNQAHRLLVQAIYRNQSMLAISRSVFHKTSGAAHNRTQGKVIEALEFLRDFKLKKYRAKKSKKAFDKQ